MGLRRNPEKRPCLDQILEAIIVQLWMSHVTMKSTCQILIYLLFRLMKFLIPRIDLQFCLTRSVIWTYCWYLPRILLNQNLMRIIINKLFAWETILIQLIKLFFLEASFYVELEILFQDYWGYASCIPVLWFQ